MRFLLPILFLLSLPATAQTVPPVGSDATFDVATWNVERFNEGGQTQFDRVLAVISQAEIDLWALQEMNSAARFDEIVAGLGSGWDGTWTNGSGSIGYGFIYRTDVVQRLEATMVLTNFAYEFASRPPLLLRADVTMPDTTVANVRILNVHAKCCGDQTSYNRRVNASAALKNYVDNFLAIDAPILVLGDLNDELRASIYAGQTSPYQNFRDDAARYAFVTYPLDLANVPTWCSNQSCTSGSTLDHVLVTRPLQTSYVPGSMRRYDELLAAIPQYVNTTSDHLPVYARFDFQPMATSAEETSAPQPFALQTPFPNPFREATTLTFSLPLPADVRLEVFDALGRQVATVVDERRGTGTHAVSFRAGTLPPGLYIARLSADGQTATRRLVIVP